MRKYALINNNVVLEVADLSDTAFDNLMRTGAYSAGVDITDLVPQPTVSWLLEGNTLVPYGGDLTPEQQDRHRMRARRIFGNALCDDAIEMLSVRNRALGKTPQQVSSLISTFMPIEMALRKCALPTALGGLQQIAPSFPEYETEMNYVMEQLTAYITNEV